jgi:outer membrane protein W
MSLKISIVVLVCFAVSLATSAIAGSLEKRHQIELKLGMWNQTTAVRTETNIASVSTSVGSKGLLGGLSYGHWLSEGVALNLNLGVMAVDVTTESEVSGVVTGTSTVTSILLINKLYFPRSTFSMSVRPYAYAGIGPYIGSQVQTESALFKTIVESRTEVAFGGQVGAGVDYILGRHFLIGFMLGYNLMTDFDRPISGSTNYSGPAFSLGISYLFGKGTG